VRTGGLFSAGGVSVRGGTTVLGGGGLAASQRAGAASMRSFGMVPGVGAGGVAPSVTGGSSGINLNATGVMASGMGNTAGGGGGGSSLPAPVEEDRQVALVSDSVKAEFKSALHRFVTVIEHTIQQVSGDVRLDIPEVVINDPAAASHDEGLKAVLVDAVEEWTRVIAQALGTVTDKDKGTRPLQEIEFWRNRNATLSTIYEQLSHPSVKTMLTTLELAREPALEPFRANHALLSSAYIEARENVKILSTLERHFKNLSAGSVQTVLDTIPSMMNGLRLVWIISRHYNTDDQMLPLMKRIVNELVEKVSSEVNLKVILTLAKTNPEEALRVMSQAKQVLDLWHSSYLSVRDRIEKMAEHRWEFDKRVLFERTDHMSAVLHDLMHVALVSSEFSKFFRGNELKSITNDPRALAAITRMVDKLTVPFQRLPFNIYDKSKHAKWRAEIAALDAKVAEIERLTEEFIQRAFSQLRSSEGAFDLLQKFKSIEMRDSIRALLEANTTNIVTKARRELEATARLFNDHRTEPPVHKNHPPVAGAISWASGLYLKQKRPIVRFKTMPSLFAGTEGELLRREYLAFAKAVDGYVKSLYGAWCERAKETTAGLLRQSVLGPALLPEGSTLRARDILGGAGAGADGPRDAPSLKDKNGMAIAAAAAAAATVVYPELAADAVAQRMPCPPYYVNFSPELATLIRECKLLDRMGYPVPDIVMNVALQDDKLSQYCARLQTMLDRYHATLSKLTPVEANLMQVQLARLRATIRPGFSPLNWNSLHVNAYISDVSKALQDFDNVLSQVRKSCTMLDDAVTTIAEANLISLTEFEGKSCLEVLEVYDIIERYRTARLDALVHKYRSVKPVMQQIEGLIASTDTCASPALAEFYRFWERKFFNAIVRCIVASILSFQALLNLVHTTGGAFTGPPRPPLCRMKASLASPEVILSPDKNTFSKYLRRIMNQLLNSAKAFRRWMDGTCLEVETMVPAGEAAPDFSFYEEIRKHQEVVGLIFASNPRVVKVLKQAERFAEHWSQYGTQYGLWNPRKPDTEKRLIERAPSAVYFDTRLAAFTTLANNVDALSVERNIGFLRVDCAPIAVACRNQALRLKADFGHALREISRKKLGDFLARVSVPGKRGGGSGGGRGVCTCSVRNTPSLPPRHGADG